MTLRKISCLLLTLCTHLSLAEETPGLPGGEAVIRRAVGDSEIVITTTARLAGAIHSLTWNGRELIDSVDHGRQLQSAANFDAGGPIKAETFNPTEAGSRLDGAGKTSTSRLLHQVVAEGALQTTTQMAFWLAPGETSGGHPARNVTLLSNHLLTKRVTIGWQDQPHVVQYAATFHVPVGERHRQAVFEVVTGYMPAEFDTFWRFDAADRKLLPLSDGPGEQADPVVLATVDGTCAMGCVSLGPEVPGGQGPGYGRFRFERERVVKWNCVYRYSHPDVLPAGDYPFKALVIVGTRDSVEETIGLIVRRQSE